MGYYDDMKGMETRLREATWKLLRAWRHGLGGGSPAVGSDVHRGLQGLAAAFRHGNWEPVRAGLPARDEDACIGDEYVRSQNVLVATKGGEVYMAYFWRSGSADGGDLHYGWKHVGRDGYDVEDEVVKWQPIPKA